MFLVIQLFVIVVVCLFCVYTNMDFAKFILALFNNTPRTYAFLLRWTQKQRTVQPIHNSVVVHGGKDQQLYMQKRDAVGRQSHRSMRLVAQTKLAVRSIEKSSAPVSSTSLIEELCAFFQTLLTQPMRVVVYSDRHDTLIYPFGTGGNTDQYYIAASVLTANELHALLLLVNNAWHWAERNQDDTIQNCEFLYASSATNNTINCSIPRMQLVRLTCDAHLRLCPPEQHLCCKQLLDAALIAAANGRQVLRYRDELFEQATVVRNQAGARPAATDLHRHMLRKFTQNTRPVVWSTPHRHKLRKH